MVLAVADRPTRETPPEVPAPEVWRCANPHCGRTLGVVSGQSVTIREGRREIVATLPCVQRCGTCGTYSRRD